MKLIIKNLATEYRDEGVGPVILFLHGWQDDLRTFDYLVPLLATSFRVVRVDLPGFGGTEMPPEAWCLDDYIEFVRDFIVKLDLPIYAIAGHSFGGRITIKSQAKNIFQADKIILIGAAGVAKRDTIRHLIIKVVAKVGKIVTLIPPLIFWRKELRQKMYGQIGSDYLGAGQLKETYLKIIGEDLSLIAGKINKPTLLIWGTNDTETPVSEGKFLAKLIPHSILEIIAGAGHFVHRDQPERVATFIKNFLS